MTGKPENPPAFLPDDLSEIDELESNLIRLIKRIHEDATRACEPYVRQLAAIRAAKPRVYIVPREVAAMLLEREKRDAE